MYVCVCVCVRARVHVCSVFRCSLFLLDKSRNNLVATVFNGDVQKVCTVGMSLVMCMYQGLCLRCVQCMCHCDVLRCVCH